MTDSRFDGVGVGHLGDDFCILRDSRVWGGCRNPFSFRLLLRAFGGDLHEVADAPFVEL
jgi:hypothetical protein